MTDETGVAVLPHGSTGLWQEISSLRVPTVIKGNLRNWECVNWSLEDWAAKCEDIPFNFRCGSKTNTSLLETENVYVQSELKDFVLWLKTKNEELTPNNPLKRFDSEDSWCYSSYNYMAKVFQEKQTMLDVVDWSSFGLNHRKGYDSTLWIGSRNSNTPCHQDSYGSNLVAQLIGEKLWVLYPPESSDSLYPTRVPYEESSVFSSVNTLHPDLIAFPNFKDAKPYIVVLKPGDVLYVPPKWWHFVCCLDAAVSINTWVEHELDDVWRLEEAIARFIMTGFVPQYADVKSDWLNPTEELFSGKETTSLLQMAVDRVTSKKEEISAINTELNASSSCVLENAIKLSPVSFEEFEEWMRSATVYERACGSNCPKPVVNVVNNFLSSNVLKTVAKNLLGNKK